ncbi:hypothetical protein EI534_25825 [Pseudomonas frederiksbergensis]|nr:hypothetical protein [Pseudomonas frederiksbergensis]
MGASLLAIAVDQSILMLNVPPSSRAGSLPQVSSTWPECACLKALKVTSCKLQDLAPLPTLTPESAGLCALGPLGNLIRVTAHQ